MERSLTGVLVDLSGWFYCWLNVFFHFIQIVNKSMIQLIPKLFQIWIGTTSHSVVRPIQKSVCFESDLEPNRRNQIINQVENVYRKCERDIKVSL